jgi:hypothetical protein
MMSDENWIRELAKAHRERQAEEDGQLGKHWDRLSSGELSAEEEAELLALAEASEEGREAYEAFRPLGPEFHASAVKAIREQAIREQAEQAIQEQGFVPVLPVLSAEPPARQKPPAWLWPFSWRPQFAGWGAAAAVAAALLLWFPRPPVPLPVYSSLEIHGDQAVRGEESSPAEVTVLAPGDRFQGQLQLAALSQAKDLEDQYFLIGGQGLSRLEVDSAIDPGGAVKINKGLVPGNLSPGAWTLWAVVGRRGKLPDPAEVVRLSKGAQIQQKDWVAVPKKVQIRRRTLPP